MATIAEKILAAHSGRDNVSPGDFANVRVDMILANDITGPISIREFRRLGVTGVFDPSKIVMVPDHFIPNKDIPSAIQAKAIREFAREQGVRYYEAGRGGIEHVLLPEQGLVGPGQVVIGADSHTCTYGALGAFATGMGSTDIAAAMATGDIWMKVPHTIKFVFHGRLQPWVGGKDLILHAISDIGIDGALYAAMEFHGEAVSHLDMDGRFTMANMAIEAGAKAGIFPVDATTESYVAAHPQADGTAPYKAYTTDSDADSARIIEYDAQSIEPVVAFPHLPSHVKPVTPGRSRPDGPGGHRQLHQRKDWRSKSGGADTPRPFRTPFASMYRHPRHAAGVPGGNAGRTHRGVPRCGRCCEHAYVRPLSGGIHGHPGAG